MRKTLCALLALVALLTLACALAEENLIVNGDFSQLDGELPAGWRKELWLTDKGISLLGVEADGWEGGGVYVTNVDANDARFVQTVAVEPDTLYRISGMIRAENCDGEGYGANLSVGGVFVYSDAKYDTAGKWEYVELYGRTGSDQTSVDVYCRVGGYGTLSRGKGWFDSIDMTEVDRAPDGAIVYDFFAADSGSSGNGPASDPEEPVRYTQAWLLFICIWTFLAVGAVRKRGRTPIPGQAMKLTPALWVLLGAALLVRLVVALRVPGYYTDISCFTGWSERMYANGPLRFYAPDYFCDYPRDTCCCCGRWRCSGGPSR